MITHLITPFEKDSSQTATYTEVIDFYKNLDKYSPFVVVQEAGVADIGKPIHCVILSHDNVFTPEEAHKKGKCIWFINNGIHPGEPEGIDATMLLLREYANPKYTTQLKNIIMVVIPVYNVDGCLNRGSFSRANQNGPSSYGFRGNAQNLDLNRDFVKCNSKNAKSFNHLFSTWNPDVFVDNHTSNGADYPYTMTLIPTQHNKLGTEAGALLRQEMLPFLYEKMKQKQWEMCPYVNSDGPPDTGIEGFLDHPRYSTGYAALHHTIGFMPETHMLKPFPDRVHSTFAFMEAVLEYLMLNAEKLCATRRAEIQKTMEAGRLPIQWQTDETAIESLMFKGYAAKYKKSEVSGLDRLYYDRSEPYEKEIPYRNTCKPILSIPVPKYYLIPQAYSGVIERLGINGVQFKQLENDVEIETELYYIRDYKTTPRPYEGCYLHYDIKVEVVQRKHRFYKGDFLIPTGQPAKRYLVSVLEPQATDSFFAWGFFDGILQQKEHFSDYVFEDLAAELLRKQPELRRGLDTAKTLNPEVAASAQAQLEWVYRHSPYYEPTHNLYPVGRIMTAW